MPALIVNEYIHVRGPHLSQNDQFNNVGESKYKCLSQGSLENLN